MTDTISPHYYFHNILNKLNQFALLENIRAHLRSHYNLCMNVNFFDELMILAVSFDPLLFEHDNAGHLSNNAYTMFKHLHFVDIISDVSFPNLGLYYKVCCLTPLGESFLHYSHLDTCAERAVRAFQNIHQDGRALNNSYSLKNYDQQHISRYYECLSKFVSAPDYNRITNLYLNNSKQKVLYTFLLDHLDAYSNDYDIHNILYPLPTLLTKFLFNKNADT